MCLRSNWGNKEAMDFVFSSYILVCLKNTKKSLSDVLLLESTQQHKIPFISFLSFCIYFEWIIILCSTLKQDFLQSLDPQVISAPVSSALPSPTSAPSPHLPFDTKHVFILPTAIISLDPQSLCFS